MNDNAKHEITPQAKALLKLTTAKCAAALNWDYRFSDEIHKNLTGLLALATKALREQSDSHSELIAAAGVNTDYIFDEWEWHESSTAFFGVVVSVHDMHENHGWLTKALAEEEKRYDEYDTKDLVGPRFIASLQYLCSTLGQLGNDYEAQWITSQPQDSQAQLVHSALTGGSRGTFMGELGAVFSFIAGRFHVVPRYPVNEHPAD
jgi:hypothetical protein